MDRAPLLTAPIQSLDAARDCTLARPSYYRLMTDVAAILGISTLCMVLIAIITSSDFPLPVPLPPIAAALRNAAGAIELPPFASPWRGLYDGLDVSEHLRRALPPPTPERKLPRVALVQAGPYR